MNDYTWPSVYFAYLFFFLSLGVAVFFFVRSLKDGYWTRESEEIKLQVFEEEPIDNAECGAGYPARGPAFQPVQPPERRLAARIGCPTSSRT